MRAWAETKQGQTLNYLAKAALDVGLIVKHDATEMDAVLKAADATACYAGVVTSPVSVAIDQRVDVQNTGVAKVEAAGAIVQGQTVIANAAGKAVAGTTGYILGVALESCAAPVGVNKSYVSVSLEIHKA